MALPTSIVLVGCGGLALEVCSYITDNGNWSNLANRSFHVTDILASSADRYKDICSVLGSRPPAVHTMSSQISDWAMKSCIICIGDPVVRSKLFQELEILGAKFTTLIHHSAFVAESAEIGIGVVVAPFSFVGPKARVKDNSVLNVRSTVGHDVVVGQSSVLSPHVNFNGASSCGNATFVGAGAIVDPEVKIGSYCKVSSGAIVKRDFPDGFLVTGNPAIGRKIYNVPECGSNNNGK